MITNFISHFLLHKYPQLKTKTETGIKTNQQTHLAVSLQMTVSYQSKIHPTPPDHHTTHLRHSLAVGSIRDAGHHTSKVIHVARESSISWLPACGWEMGCTRIYIYYIWVWKTYNHIYIYIIYICTHSSIVSKLTSSILVTVSSFFKSNEKQFSPHDGKRGPQSRKN